MSNESPFESVSLTNQVILLAVTELASENETPVQTHKLRQHCQRRLPEVDTEVVGTITEADVIRSLYRLEDEGLVDEVSPAETSPTGKGRPAYTLAVSAEMVYEEVADELLNGSPE
jgi:predicted transcriptional regulator